MKKNSVLIIAVIVLTGGAFYSQQYFVESYPPTQKILPDSLTFTAKTGGTVLEAMNTLSADGSLSFSGRDFPGLGFFVEAINGKKSENGYYWILHINGKKSDLGASSAHLKAGDVVEWQYEKGY